MATRYYFRSTTNSTTGLPTARQSTLTSTATSTDAATVNRTLSTTIGTTQSTLAITTAAVTTQQTYYFSRFVGPAIGAQTISANTWTYNFAAKETNAAANFPCTSSAQPVYISCYVWRPSTTTKIGTILEGNSNSNFSEALTLEAVSTGTFAGAAVTANNNDVIVFEVWFRVTQAGATSYTVNWYYDGAVVNTTAAASVTNHASFIETPQNITDPSIDMTPNLLTLTNKFITKI